MRTAVEISTPVIWNAPSPTSTYGRSFFVAMATPMLAGTAKPIDM